MPRRTERVGSLIREILAEAIQTRLSDPRIPPITSITRVEVSRDFAVARVYVSVVAPESKRQLCLRALRHAAGHLRWLLGPQLTLRRTPALDFHLDESVRGSFETVQLIDRVMGETRVGALGPGAAQPEASDDEEEQAGDGMRGSADPDETREDT